MSAMQGGHARFEERRLFKYLQARWSVDIGHLPEEHRELERREEAVATAMAAVSSQAIHRQPAAYCELWDHFEALLVITGR